MEIFSFVTKFTTLCIFLALATYLNFNVHQVDIIVAYLQKDLDEKIKYEDVRWYRDLYLICS